MVIPTRDRWKLLLAAGLRAALGQTEVALEVLVVDDGSAEAPPGHPALEDPRVRLVSLTHPGGVAAARNRGIADARGSWIAFLDDDDLWSPSKLRRQLDAAAASGAGFVYGGAVLTDGSGTQRLRLPTPDELVPWLRSSSAIPAGASNVMVAAGLVRDAGGFDERFSHLTDWDLWIRLAEVTVAVACEEVLVAMRIHDHNMRATSTRSVWPEFRRLAAKRRSAGGPDLDGRALAQWIAAQHARSGRHAEAAGWYTRAALAGRNLALLAAAARALGGADPDSAAPRAPEPDWISIYQ